MGNEEDDEEDDDEEDDDDVVDLQSQTDKLRLETLEKGRVEMVKKKKRMEQKMEQEKAQVDNTFVQEVLKMHHQIIPINLFIPPY